MLERNISHCMHFRYELVMIFDNKYFVPISCYKIYILNINNIIKYNIYEI